MVETNRPGIYCNSHLEFLSVDPYYSPRNLEGSLSPNTVKMEGRLFMDLSPTTTAALTLRIRLLLEEAEIWERKAGTTLLYENGAIYRECARKMKNLILDDLNVERLA